MGDTKNFVSSNHSKEVYFRLLLFCLSPKSQCVLLTNVPYNVEAPHTIFDATKLSHLTPAFSVSIWFSLMKNVGIAPEQSHGGMARLGSPGWLPWLVTHHDGIIQTQKEYFDLLSTISQLLFSKFTVWTVGYCVLNENVNDV